LDRLDGSEQDHREGLQEVGINAQSNFPDYGGYLDQRNQATFDMMIANDAQMSNTRGRTTTGCSSTQWRTLDAAKTATMAATTT